MRKVAVLFGGKSCENEISVLTGVFALNLLSGEQYEILPVYIHTDGGMYTSSKMRELETFRGNNFAAFERIFFDGGIAYAFHSRGRKIKRLGKIDVALNCCHGGLGEGGGVSAIMEWNSIPLASPALTPSALFLDKYITKVVLKGLRIPTLDYIRVNERDYEKRGAFLLKTIEGKLKYPVIVKPAHLGSSLGISVAKDEGEAKRAIENAFALDDRVIIEKFLAEKLDVNCAAYALNGEIFVSEPEVAFGEGVYSFEEKYIKRTADGMVQKSGSRYALKGELRDKIRAYTKTVYKRTDMQGIVRMDFLVSGKEVYLCEVNTVPGSLAYYLFCERLTDARNFFSALIEEALLQANKEKELVSTGILRTVKTARK